MFDGVPAGSRPAARVLVINEQHRLLYLHACESSTGKEFWVLPGGGLKPQENFQDAAIREVRAVTLAWLVYALSVTSWTSGALLGMVIGIGFIATAMASDAAFCRSGMRLFLIQAGYRVVYSILMGAILGVWH